ncbi:MAG TPA: cache domain-containing protein [Acetivibrio clariflavus]|nr:cache domain-containing protein [Acetivibrio clariflavus]HPU40803.1 cache domain-containing protein [Acetivibrio clariflavus]
MAAISTVENEREALSEVITGKLVDTEKFAKNETVLKLLAGNYNDNDMKDINQWMADYVKDNPETDNVFLADEKAKIIVSSEPSTVGTTLGDMEYAKKVLSSGMAEISEVLVSDLTGKPIVVFSQPVVNQDSGKRIGFVGASVYIESIVRGIIDSKINNADSSNTFIIDKKGNYVWTSDESKIGKSNGIKLFSDMIANLKKGEIKETSAINYRSEKNK